ncbi:beta-galactosidase [Mycobacterium sp. HNNTM2301]|uniref:beta-galactosidase n=1 Tax=Mycobacterium hainanense TaxID=3289775 RepID=UPI0035A60DCA
MRTKRGHSSDHGIPRQTFLRGAVSLLATAGMLPSARAAADRATDWSGLTSSTEGAITTEMSVIPYSAPDIPNPGRGMYDWNGVIDFPVGSAASWPVGPEYYLRCNWSDIQTRNGTYDWAFLDHHVETAASNGQRLALCVMPINPWRANGVPNYLRGTSAVTAYRYGGATWYEPNYNDPEYLAAACEFITALGTRYDKDERLAWFEVSLYGDWSEGHCSQSINDLGLAVASPAESMAALGHWDGYRQQLITLASITQLVNAHISAFPNTQLICPGGGACYPIPKLLYAAYTAAEIAKPPGFRYDGLSAPRTWFLAPLPTWAIDPASYYVSINDPLVAVMMRQWQIAPIPSEQGDYTDYDSCLVNVVNYGVTLVASQNAGATTDSLGLAIKYSGYRYAVSSVTAPPSIPQGDGLPIEVTWTNYNVCPTYDNWQIVYQLRNNAGTVVSSLESSFNLRTLFNPAQCSTDPGQGLPSDPSVGPPLGASSTDAITIPTTGLAPGVYTIAVVVTWNEHKAGATYTWNYPPMRLAQTTGRNSDGSYPLVDVALT